MLVCSALISNSRALTKAATSSSPFLFRALSELWARIERADEVKDEEERGEGLARLAGKGGPVP